MSRSLTWMSLAVLLCASSARAQSTASSGPDSEGVRGITWSAHVETTVYRWTHTAPPGFGDFSFLGQRVSRNLRPSAIELLGVSAEARLGQAAVSGTLRGSVGLGSSSALLRPSELVAVPVAPEVRMLSAQARYRIVDTATGFTLDAAVFFQYRNTNIEATIPNRLFGARMRNSQLFLALPASHRLGRLTVHGRLGASIWGWHQTSYDIQFARYPETLDRPTPMQTLLRYEEATPHSQLAELGVVVPLGRLLIGATACAERTVLPDVYTDTLLGMSVSISLRP